MCDHTVIKGIFEVNILVSKLEASLINLPLL
jgi:hypothetical protein